jgi:hypothetical protein
VRVRRGGAAASVAAGVLFLAACGQSSSDPLAPAHAFTRADGEIARGVDVRQSDVPSGYRPHGSRASGREKCAPDLSDLTLTAADRSDPFVARGAAGYVLGEVDVYRTPSQTAAAFARVTGAARRRCLLQIATAALTRFYHGRIAVGAIPHLPTPAGVRLLGRRFTESWQESGGRRVQTTDDVYLLAGRTLVIMSFFRDRGAFPAADEARTIERVAARARAAIGRAAARTHPGGKAVSRE